jgi:hypothetical protein
LHQVEDDHVKHILIPTDGTEFSEVAIKAGIQFAKEIRAA